MSSRVRRPAWPVALSLPVLVAALATPVVALAAPTGVLFDGRATVEVRAAEEPGAAPGAGPGGPLSGVLVTVVTYVTDFPEAPPMQPPLMGFTGPDGRVSFTGLARPAEPGVAVHLAVDAFRETASLGADGCTTTEVRAGNVADLTWPPPDPIVVEAVRSARVVCPGPPILEGRLLDSHGDPLEVQRAWVSIGLPGAEAGTLPLAVGPDGGFVVSLPAVGTFLEPAILAVHAVSPPTRSEPFGNGCLRTYAEQVSWTREVALAEGTTLGHVELGAVETVVGERCGTVATQPPDPAPGAPTPPATTPGTPAARPPTNAGPATWPSVGVQAPSGTPAASARTPATPVTSAGVAARTAVPQVPERETRPPDAARPSPAAGPPRAAIAGSPGAVGPTELIALLGAMLLMAVTMAIVVRLSRRT